MAFSLDVFKCIKNVQLDASWTPKGCAASENNHIAQFKINHKEAHIDDYCRVLYIHNDLLTHKKRAEREARAGPKKNAVLMLVGTVEIPALRQ